MSAQLKFYRDRASEAHAGAAAAVLQNVRDRWLSSAASWTALADQSERAQVSREKAIADKANDVLDREAVLAPGLIALA